MSATRIGAMILRYVYLLRSSWPRVLELIYWPLVQLLMWGFLQTNLVAQSSGLAMVGATFIGAFLLWDILARAQLGFSISFLEEMWSRNIGNLMMSPLRPSEFVAALMVMSLIRLAIGILPVTFFCIWFFGFNFWSLGLALPAFFANLFLTAWAIGLIVSGLVLRHGLGAETLAWTLIFLILPIVCVYYPVTSLPAPLQYIAWALPPTYVFEGMRAALIDRTFRADLMMQALVLNIALFAAAIFLFQRLLDSARQQGSLLQTGE
jgi:ABC-2 type transport system permease protein